MIISEVLFLNVPHVLSVNTSHSYKTNVTLLRLTLSKTESQNDHPSIRLTGKGQRLFLISYVNGRHYLLRRLITNYSIVRVVSREPVQSLKRVGPL